MNTPELVLGQNDAASHANVSESSPAESAPKMPYQEPISARGRRTRAELISAARKVFVRDGFPDSRIVDIVKRARSSIGSFYTYFESKEDILAAVLAEAQSDMLHLAVLSDGDEYSEQPAHVLEFMFRRYFTFYRDNVGLMLLIEQVASIDSEFRAEKRERELDHIRRNTEVVAAWRENGLADFEGEPFPLVNALSGMINRYAYNHWAMGSDDDPQALTDTCVYAWTQALRISRA